MQKDKLRPCVLSTQLDPHEKFLFHRWIIKTSESGEEPHALLERNDGSLIMDKWFKIQFIDREPNWEALNQYQENTKTTAK